jgi:predicted MFS family arabinose efflux permease
VWRSREPRNNANRDLLRSFWGWAVTRPAQLPRAAERDGEADGSAGPAAKADPARPAGSGQGGHQPSWRVLRQRPFQIYFAGSLVSNLGSWLQNTAQMLLAYRLTHSAFAVGLVSCAQFSGFLALGPWAPRIARRLGGRRLLFLTQAASAGIAGAMAALYFTGVMTEAWLIGGALAIGLAFALAAPVQAALVSRLVPAHDTRAALAMNSVSYNAGRTLAPVLAIVVLIGIGTGGAFALNAVSFAVFAAAIWALRPHADEQAHSAPVSLSGLRIALQRPRIWLLLAMVAAITLAEDPVLVLGPTVARQQLHMPASSAAYFLSALGAGTVLGCVIPVRRAGSRTAAMSLLLLAAAMFTFINSSVPPVTLVAAAVAGMAGLLTGSAAQALLLKTAGPQNATPVMALWAIAWAGSKPLASLADGWIASHHGVFWAGIFLVGPALLVAVGELFMPRISKQWVKGWAYQIGFALTGR